MAADPGAREKDLPDLCAFMLASGVRTGGPPAVDWADVDLDGRLVVIEHQKAPGQGSDLGLGLLRLDSNQ